MASCLDDIRCMVWVNCTINAVCGSIAYKDMYWPEQQMKTNVKIPDGPIPLIDFFDVPEEGELVNMVDGVFPFYNRPDVSYMFIAGSDDQCAAAKRSAREAEILLNRAEHPDFEIAYYEEAGHMLEPPYSPHCSVLFQPGPTFDIALKCGGELIAHCKAQEHCWHKQLSFLKTRLQ
uniref:Bile acid-CoA:amino acid N-acyltransferase-like n=1 Tax=Phallusia mammillata TaxID=59560 RepID=A0A6F9D6U0_9ASCI|nr:bile acid-CoA:amino acid N-acyltransferase-like [Phallusia mammillata]